MDPRWAWNLLEFCRGIIAGLVIDCRNDLSELKSKYPDMANTFYRLRCEVDSPAKSSSITRMDPLFTRGESGKHESAYQQERRRELVARDLQETLIAIRALPGFEGFQRPPRSEDLMKMAGEGPIVIFNSSMFRSDAIIVTPSTIKPLALPKLSFKSVEEKMSRIAKIVRGKRSAYQSRNQEMAEFLLWLWDVAVEPVLETLQFNEVSDGNLPRIWWIGAGKLAIAPFHAAGDHSRGSTRNTISRVISSYIPTIKALSFARERELELLSRPDSRLLLVSMPTTPAKAPSKSQNSLKEAIAEVKEVLRMVEGKTLTTELVRPSATDVLKELPLYNAIHFACHGVSDGTNPSNSRLLLCKDSGLKTETLDELTVGAISNINIRNAQMAYLSACSTAENAPDTLADESIYISSGFQLAGFSHMLATQWPSNDSACRKVAGNFYKSLYGDEPCFGEGHGRVSTAFHYAVKRLRDEMLNQPIKWACYIHTGA